MKTTFNETVTLLDKADKIDVEYCYSGFMGNPLNIFLWNDKMLMAVITRDDRGRWAISQGLKFTKQQKAAIKAAGSH